MHSILNRRILIVNFFDWIQEKAWKGGKGKGRTDLELADAAKTFQATYRGNGFFFFYGWNRNCKFPQFHLGGNEGGKGDTHAREKRRRHHTKIIQRQNPGRRSRGGGQITEYPGGEAGESRAHPSRRPA